MPTPTVNAGLASGASGATAAVTKAVVANCVVFVPGDAVGPEITPLNVTGPATVWDAIVVVLKGLWTDDTASSAAVAAPDASVAEAAAVAALAAAEVDALVAAVMTVSRSSIVALLT
jgi:hypothetical protein